MLLHVVDATGVAAGRSTPRHGWRRWRAPTDGCTAGYCGGRRRIYRSLDSPSSEQRWVDLQHNIKAERTAHHHAPTFRYTTASHRTDTHRQPRLVRLVESTLAIAESTLAIARWPTDRRRPCTQPRRARPVLTRALRMDGDSQPIHSRFTADSQRAFHHFAQPTQHEAPPFCHKSSR